MRTCPKCNTEHNNSGVFCSRTCANSRGPRSSDFKTAVSQKLSIPLEERICEVCHSKFNHARSKKKRTCSPVCRQKLDGLQKVGKPSPKHNYNPRPDMARAHTGWYKGYALDSRWELAYLIYCLDHGKHIERNSKGYPYTFNDKEHRYFPDFRVEGMLVEIKGYRTDISDAKIAAVDEPIQVLYKEELKPIFQYVTQKTGLPINRLHELYER